MVLGLSFIFNNRLQIAIALLSSSHEFCCFLTKAVSADSQLIFSFTSLWHGQDTDLLFRVGAVAFK